MESFKNEIRQIKSGESNKGALLAQNDGCMSKTTQQKDNDNESLVNGTAKSGAHCNYTHQTKAPDHISLPRLARIVQREENKPHSRYQLTQPKVTKRHRTGRIKSIVITQSSQSECGYCFGKMSRAEAGKEKNQVLRASTSNKRKQSLAPMYENLIR